MWLDVLEPPPPPPFVQGTLVDMDSIMEHVSGSQDLLLSLLLSLFVDVTTFAAAAAAKSSEKKRKRELCNQEKSILEGSWKNQVKPLQNKKGQKNFQVHSFRCLFLSCQL